MLSGARMMQAARSVRWSLKVVDIGTGSGVLAVAAAQAGAGAWQQKTIQPLLDTVNKELSAGS